MADTTANKRVLVLSDSINGGTVGTLIKQIVEFNIEDDKQESILSSFERKPITIIINSFGGSGYDCFALIGAIEMSGTQIITVAMGSVMSAAFTIFLAGHARFAHRHATFMYHELAYGFGGNLTENIERTEEMIRMMNQYDEYVLERTEILAEKLTTIRKQKENWYITAHEAKKLGIVHEVIHGVIDWE